MRIIDVLIWLRSIKFDTRYFGVRLFARLARSHRRSLTFARFELIKVMTPPMLSRVSFCATGASKDRVPRAKNTDYR